MVIYTYNYWLQIPILHSKSLCFCAEETSQNHHFLAKSKKTGWNFGTAVSLIESLFFGKIHGSSMDFPVLFQHFPHFHHGPSVGNSAFESQAAESPGPRDPRPPTPTPPTPPPGPPGLKPS